MNERFTKWDAVHELKSEEDIALYFEACLDDDPGDGSLIRAAKDIPVSYTHLTLPTKA